MKSITIDVPAPFAPFIPVALARLAYLHPGVEWSFNSGSNQLEARFALESHSAEEVRKEAFFQLYRERIHHDTLAVRNRIYEAIGS
jgi:hypothetical protein